MNELLDRAQRLQVTRVDSDLLRYVGDGLVVQEDGSIVSVAAAKGAHADRARFVDRVDYESFANKIHLDDWSSDALTAATVEEKLAHALLLGDRVGAWAEEGGW